MAILEAPVEHTTAAALEEKAKLRKHFGRFDIFFFLICTIVGLDTLGSVASYGAQAFIWLIFLGVFFFLPYAMLVAELGSTFRDEGGSYIWTKLSLGRLTASINGIMYWMSNPIWLGGTLAITAYTTFTTFFWDPSAGQTKFVEIIFGLIFIWTATWSAILSFGVGKWIPTIGAWVRVTLLSAFTLTVAIYAMKNGVHGVGGSDFKPTAAVFFAAVPVLFFNFVGFELPSAAGDEMKDPQKDVPVTIRRAWLVAILAYGLPILAILLVLPKDQITNLGGFIDAIKTVFTVFGGSVAADGTATLTGFGAFLGGIAAIGFILALLSSGATWIMGADRAEAVACYDGAGPRVLGYFSKKYGTPLAVNLASGVLATIVLILAVELTNGNTAKYFTAVLGLAISTTTISYLGIFPALAILRYKFPHLHRPYAAPGGLAGTVVISALTTAWALVATVGLLWPGALSALPFVGDPADASLPSGFQHDRTGYELSQLVPLGVMVGLGLLFYALGSKTRRAQVDVSLDESMVEPPFTPAPPHDPAGV
jgi:glutamate:GABA antiporter